MRSGFNGTAESRALPVSNLERAGLWRCRKTRLAMSWDLPSGNLWLLEFEVGTEGGHEDRAPVAVVAGVADVLHAGRKVDAAPHMHGVIRLDYVFAAVVQMAVTQE